MTTDAALQLVMSGGSGMLGVVVAFVTMRLQVRRNTKNISHLRSDFNKITGAPTGLPVYARRDEVTALNDKVAGLQRYARYQLTKNGMPLNEVNELLGGS